MQVNDSNDIWQYLFVRKLLLLYIFIHMIKAYILFCSFHNPICNLATDAI